MMTKVNYEVDVQKYSLPCVTGIDPNLFLVDTSSPGIQYSIPISMSKEGPSLLFDGLYQNEKM